MRRRSVETIDVEQLLLCSLIRKLPIQIPVIFIEREVEKVASRGKSLFDARVV